MEIISAVFGFFAPFATEIFKYFQKEQDNKHELAVLQLQVEAKAKEHLYKMEEIETVADIEEQKAVRMPERSFGVQLLDAAKGHQMTGWAMYPAFYLFALLDLVSSLVRPAVTYTAFLFYIAVKWAQLQVYMANSANKYEAILQVWTGSDMSIVILVLSYWFGQRAAKAAFGGSANTTIKDN